MLTATVWRPVKAGLALAIVTITVGCGGQETMSTGDWVRGPMNENVTSLGEATQDCAAVPDWVEAARDEPVPDDEQLAEACEGVIEAADDFASVCEDAAPEEQVDALGAISRSLGAMQARVAEL